MFSKRIFALSLFLLLSSCSDFLRGPKHEPESLDLPTGALACLQKLPENFAKIENGTATATQVDTDFRCLESALMYFQERTVGTYKEAYTAEDFRRFFGKYFLTKNNISKSFADQLVLLKSAVIGGSPGLVSKVEVVQLASFIGVLRAQLIQLLPSLEVLMQKASTADQGQIDQAMASVKVAGQALLKVSALHKSEYTFEDLHGLAVEVGSFIGLQSHSQVAVDFKKYWPLFASAKKVLLGEEANLQSPLEWIDAMDSFADLYNLVLQDHYLLKGFHFNSISDLDQIGNSLENFLSLLLNSNQLKKHNFIPCSQLDEMIDHLYDTRLVNSAISNSTLKETYRTVLGRMTSGVRFQSANEVINLTQDHVHYLIREVRIWRSLQGWINTLSNDSAKELSWSVVKNSFNSYASLHLGRFQTAAIPVLQKEELQAAMNDFMGLLNQKRPVKFNLQGRFILQYDTTVGGVTWTSLSLSNMTYMFTRLMLRGYSEFSQTTKKVMISEHEFIRWYDDFRKIGLELKAFDPRPGQTNSGSRSAKEANFFMLSSNGDREIDFNELYEYISMLVSAGLRSVDAVRAMATLEHCLDLDSKDLLGRPLVDDFKLPFIKEKEFKAALTKHRAELFNNLPYLIDYFQKYPERWSEFYDRLLDAARLNPAGSGHIDHGDLRVFVMMMHYQESLLLAFDQNRDALLSIPELEKAVPRFLSFLKDLHIPIPWFLQSADESLLKHGFIYLAIEGHQPSGSDWIGYVWDRIKDPMLGQERKVDRVGVAQVFRNLKQELKKP